MARQRMTAARWAALIAQQQASGMSIDAFCRRHQLPASTFFAWRRKLSEPNASMFVELTHEAEPASAAPIELVLPGGVVVRVREGFDASILRQVVEALS